MITYRLSHPQLSHPLEMESAVERTDRALIAWATMYILREFDEMVERSGWAVEVARPANDLGNVVREDGVDRCPCGSKYWEHDACVDCGGTEVEVDVENRCPTCGGPVTVWADNSDGVTVNFECTNQKCAAGKPPWDTPKP